MIKNATIVRPSWLEGLYSKSLFIPPNSSDYLIKIDMGFKVNPVYEQEKLCLILPDNIYYQQLTLTDGKSNLIKDDARTIVITGEIEEPNPIKFYPDVFPEMPKGTSIGEELLLPVYPEIETELIVRDSLDKNLFHHFSCTKIIYRPTLPTYLQLRYIERYLQNQLHYAFRKWHRTEISVIENVPAL